MVATQKVRNNIHRIRSNIKMYTRNNKCDKFIERGKLVRTELHEINRNWSGFLKKQVEMVKDSLVKKGNKERKA